MKRDISFQDDYSDTGHSKLAKALFQHSGKKEKGYGYDGFSEKAREFIKKEIQQKTADIYFVSGGTQANLIAISAMLKPYEAVIACESGHIIHHEAGAVEATGHKIIYGKGVDGKLTPEIVVDIVTSHADEHMVHPKAVFVSQATEMGTVYTKKELKDLRDICNKYDLYLYIDGARLGSALAASDCDLSDIAKYSDIFYIGGTKNGALMGEALVVLHKDIQEKFAYSIKQRGGLLAKGSSIGIQFLEFFKNGLYQKIATERHARAMQLKKGLEKFGIAFLTTPETNQLFPILPESIVRKLEKNYQFYRWRKIDKKNVTIRLVVSYDIEKKDIEKFLSDLKKLIY